MRSQRVNPSDGELGGGDTLPSGYGLQVFDEGEVLFDVLGDSEYG